MFFDSWSDLWRTIVVGAAAYVALVVVLQASGKRTLAKLNAFDFVVTVAFGSTLATILLNSSVSWAEGAVAFTVLAGLQFLVATTSTRWPRTRRLLTTRPTVLLRDGRPLPEAMGSQRISRNELCQAVRSAGVGSLDAVAAVVLESDGSLSVITTEALGDGSALQDVPSP